MKTNRQLEILVIKTSFDMSAKDYPSGAPGTKSVPNLPVRDFSVSVRRRKTDRSRVHNFPVADKLRKKTRTSM